MPGLQWIVAACTRRLEDEAARMPEGLARLTAEAFIAAARADDVDDDDPRTIQLLSAVSRHRPVALVSEACAEGECDHKNQCPQSFGCRACSLQAGEWAGEWQGRYLNECTIGAPCAVLLKLAETAGVSAATDLGSRNAGR